MTSYGPPQGRQLIFRKQRHPLKHGCFGGMGTTAFSSKDEINKQKANKRQEKLICGVTFLEPTYPLPSRRFCQ